MTIADQLAAYQTLRQRYLDYIESQLANLQNQMTEWLEELKINEHPFLIAQQATDERRDPR